MLADESRRILSVEGMSFVFVTAILQCVVVSSSTSGPWDLSIIQPNSRSHPLTLVFGLLQADGSWNSGDPVISEALSGHRSPAGHEIKG